MEYQLKINFKFADPERHKEVGKQLLKALNEDLEGMEVIRSLSGINEPAISTLLQEGKLDEELLDKNLLLENVSVNDKRISIRQVIGSDVESYMEDILSIIISLEGRLLSSRADGDEEEIIFKQKNNALNVDYKENTWA